jgi:hypothetical protein
VAVTIVWLETVKMKGMIPIRFEIRMNMNSENTNGKTSCHGI